LKTLDLQDAQALVAHALAHAAADFHRPICVAVCDAQGFLVAFGRADAAPVRSIRISQGKAYSAARMGVTTEAFLERLQRERIEISFFCDPDLTALPGGAVLKSAGGRILGGVGISGLTSAEDQVIANALAASVASRFAA